MDNLKGLRVAVLATDGVEAVELTEPVEALREAEASVDVLSFKEGSIQGFNHLEKGPSIPVDRVLEKGIAEDYDAALLPGGTSNADRLRMDPNVQAFVREMNAARKPLAVICHAPWILVSAGLMKGRTVTSYSTIQDDIRNAGGHWLDKEVVVNSNWVTSRQPSDIPAFNREMIKLFSQFSPRKETVAAGERLSRRRI